jgi:AraC family transcriptional regulator
MEAIESGASPSWIENAVEHIQRSLGGDLCLATLARRSGLSPHPFHRSFCAAVGEPPHGYVRRLRLERAAFMLRHTDRPVTDVALESGYRTHEAFTRAFRSRFRVPPSGFRGAASRPGACSRVCARIVRLPERRIAFVRCVGPYDRAETAFEGLTSWAARRGVLAGATRLTVY